MTTGKEDAFWLIEGAKDTLALAGHGQGQVGIPSGSIKKKRARARLPSETLTPLM